MSSILETLNDVAVVVEHLEDHLRLLGEAARRLDPGTSVIAEDLGGLIDRVAATPTVDHCGTPGPINPKLNNCDWTALERGIRLISRDDLARVADRGVEWCGAIRRHLGDPFPPVEPIR